MEIGWLPNHVNSCILCVCLLFNFRLLTIIDLSLGVLFAKVVSEQMSSTKYDVKKFCGKGNFSFFVKGG